MRSKMEEQKKFASTRELKKINNEVHPQHTTCSTEIYDQGRLLQIMPQNKNMK